MWTIREKYISVLLILSALLWFLPSVGGCSPTYPITEEELTALQNHLTVLETNNETLKNILSESNEDLTKALEALMKSQSELMTLKTQLQKAKNDAESAKKSLEIANQELAKANESFKQYAKDRDRTENRLRNQRNVWEFIAALAVGVAVAK